MRKTWALATATGVVTCTLVLAYGLQDRTNTASVLNHGNYSQWMDFILPDAKEERYRQIGWRTSFAKAIEEARRLEQPILLWTMNGHPMACT